MSIDKPKPVTLKDIAQELGLSINTVSGVLNPRSGVRVSVATRKKIEAVARRLNYRRNIAASRLAGGQTRTVGILLENLTHAFSAPIADAFEKEMVRNGYQCFVGCTRYDGLQKANYVNRMLEHGINGLLLTTAWNDPEIKESLPQVIDSGIPVVFVDYVWGKHPGPLVCGNHYMGGQLLASHLLDMGHRSMVFLTSQPSLQVKSIKERIRGVRSVMSEEKMDPSQLRIHSFPSSEGKNHLGDMENFQRAVDAVAEMLQSPDAPTVVLCANDVTAYLVLVMLAQKGVRVPQDIAVTGYDDLHFSFFNTMLGIRDPFHVPWAFPLTTIRQPFAEIGRTAAELMIRQIEGEELPKNTVQYLDVSLVVNESSTLPVRK